MIQLENVSPDQSKDIRDKNWVSSTSSRPTSSEESSVLPEVLSFYIKSGPNKHCNTVRSDHSCSTSRPLTSTSRPYGFDVGALGTLQLSTESIQEAVLCGPKWYPKHSLVA